MRLLVEQLARLEARLREGGGPERIERQHNAGKLTARERIAGLLDPDTPFLEIGLLIAYDRYHGHAPAAGVVTGLGRIEGRPAVLVANDATVKAGAWWPETITKILRAQEIAMRNRLPIVYLVDSAGVNLPYQDGIFPGQYGAGRIFYYNSLMRRTPAHPADRRRHGPLHRRRRLPARSQRRHHHGRGHQFHGTRRPQPRQGRHRPGHRFRNPRRRHASIPRSAASPTTWRRTIADCLDRIRERFRSLPAPDPAPSGVTQPARDPADLYSVLPPDHRLPYEIEEVIFRIFDSADYREFQPEYAHEMLCANARLAAGRWP